MTYNQLVGSLNSIGTKILGLAFHASQTEALKLVKIHDQLREAELALTEHEYPDMSHALASHLTNIEQALNSQYPEVAKALAELNQQVQNEGITTLRGEEKPVKRDDIKTGGIYSVIGDSGYDVVKVTAVDKQGVHIHLYANHFKERPKPDDIKLLHDKSASSPRAILHQPFLRTTFLEWQPQLIGEAAVTPQEREGYEMWQEAKGGYFK